MATVRAQKWSYFLKRLGFRDSKKSIMAFVDSASDSEVWEKYIAGNPCALEACRESKITCPDDIWWLFEQISYAGMRSTFPGKKIIGPKIVPMKSVCLNSNSIKESNRVVKNKTKKVQKLLSESFIGKRVRHTTFGKGVIIGVKENNVIVIQFDNYGKKLISYEFCQKNGYITFI